MHAECLRVQKNANRIGEAKRSGEGGFGDLPRQGYSTMRPRAQQARRCGEGAFLRFQCNTTCHEATKRVQERLTTAIAGDNKHINAIKRAQNEVKRSLV
jgi:hypothetical protein